MARSWSVRSGLAHGLLEGGRLQGAAHDVELVELGLRQRGDGVAEPRLVLEQPLAEQRLERLAHGDQAHPEEGRHVVERDRAAGRHGAGRDDPAQLGEHLRPGDVGVLTGQQADDARLPPRLRHGAPTRTGG